jgi:hypothetical protein
MEKLHQLEREFAQRGTALAIIGLDSHVTLSQHPAAARLRGVHRPADPTGELVAH